MIYPASEISESQQVVFSGVQPSGRLTLGNYLGAIRNWVPLQDQYTCLFCIVDLHAITQYQDPQALRQSTREVAAVYLAAGIDSQKSTLFIQSQIPQHAELAWLLNTITPLGWLNRMTQFKDKAGKHREQAALGLYAYPVLMAADILLHKAHLVPVGEDQRQHLELARDIANTFNHTYKIDFFPQPAALQSLVPRVMSLRDGTKKMSKSDSSDFSCIYLLDTADDIALKIKKAKTDPEPLPEDINDLEHRFEAKNLIKIYAALSNQTPQDILTRFAGASFSIFKPSLTELIIETLNPLRSEILKILASSDIIDQTLDHGRQQILTKSQETLKQVQHIMGLV
ncbi:MAG: tryptophan--tRNA ligase [Janthinobacterium lividum]